MSKVLSVKPDHFESGGEKVTCYQVELDDRTKPIPCYSEAAADLKVGQELPESWEVKVSKKGKDYLAVPKPRGGGGQSSWYNSEVGVRFTQERMDRRTALMQAVTINTGELGPVLDIADNLYAWLRQGNDQGAEGQKDATGGGTPERPSDPKPLSPSGGGAADLHPSPDTSSEPGKTRARSGGGEPGSEGEPQGHGQAIPPRDCMHAAKFLKDTKPNGAPLRAGTRRCLACGMTVPAPSPWKERQDVTVRSETEADQPGQGR